MIVAPYYRDAMLFKYMMFDKGEFALDDKIYYALRPEQLQGFRNMPGMDIVETWFLQGHWPVRSHREIEAMVAMETLARVYSFPYPIRRWYT